MATLLANRLKSLEAIAAASEEELADVGGVGPTIAASVAAWFGDDGNQDLVRRLVEAGVNTKADGDTGTDLPQTLAGMSFVLTGGLDGLTCEQAAQAIEDRGGRVASSVSRKTAYVVVGTDPGAKAAWAAELGVPTLDEATFTALLEQNGPMSDVWHPLDPEGSRQPDAPGRDRGPDPEPIVRTVRVAFLFAGMVAAVMVNAGLNGVGGPSAAAVPVAGVAVTAVVAVAVLAVLAVAWLACARPGCWWRASRPLATPTRACASLGAEQAQAIGFRGLAMGWASQALVFGLLPVFAGLVLELLYDRQWELLSFAAISLLAGFVFQRQIAGAVRLAVEDPELRASYGSR